jgi:hypothetical protein
MALAALPVASGAAAGVSGGVHTSARLSKAQWRPDAAVRAITVSRTRVYIAGDFTHLRNQATGTSVRRAHVAAFSRSTGALISGFHPTANGSVNALALLGRNLVLGGSFTALNGQARNRLGAVAQRSGALSPWTADVDGPVLALLAMDGRVYVGGDFQHADGFPRSHLFALDGYGDLSSTWPDQSAGTTRKSVYTLVAAPGHASVYVGGAFDKLVGSPRKFLGEISVSTGRATAWNPAPMCAGDCFVKSLTTGKSHVYAGVAGPGGWVVAFRRDTAARSWKRHTSGDVTAIALAGKYVVIGGHFTHVNHHRHRMFAELRATNGRVTNRRPATSGDPYPGILAIAVVDHRIVFGGAFDALAGQVRYGVLAE